MGANPLLGGIRFGLLLQLAVGPVCLFVFRTASERGIGRGLSAVWGVALVDALFIALAGLGVTRWAGDARARRALQYGGALIIALFALDIAASAAGIQLVPSLAGRAPAGSGSFLGAVLLTASNPLTILFWAGVFGSKIAAEGYGRKQLWLFSLGCVASTFGFLSVIALAGGWIARVLPIPLLRSLNLAVACALLWFAAQLALARPTPPGSGRPPR